MDQKLWEKTRRLVVSALADFQLLGDGDRLLVAVSGGKDSAILLKLLTEIQQRSPYSFSINAVIVDQNQPGFELQEFSDWVKHSCGITLDVIDEDTYSVVKSAVKPGKSFCGLCSRLRRGILYNYAHREGYNKLALGHHRDDANETLLLNLFFGGRIASMPPKLKSDDGRNILIRPMIYVPEEYLSQIADDLSIPIIPCNLCGSQENLQRARVKSLISEWKVQFPHIGASMLKAQQNVRPSQLIDSSLWSFSTITSKALLAKDKNN